MSLQNTPEKFGSLTKLLHWTIFLLFVIQYFLVYRREYFPKDSPEKLQYMLLHKSIGVVLLVLAVLMILWRYVGKRPPPITTNALERIGAKLMHFLLYAAMLIMPLSGIGMSLYAGYSVSVFGWFNLPITLEKNEALGNLFYTTHVWSSYAVIGLVGLHVLAALFHHFIRKDEVLKRMSP
jgi:cytochrome b561